MSELKETGGARIGMANATWPFATLTVNSGQLRLNASIIGNLVFKPSDIINIQPYTFIPLLGQGIKIVHNVSGYSSNVIFWTFGDPAALIKRIEQTGFLANIAPVSIDIGAVINTEQSTGGFPIRVPAAIAIAVTWNILFLHDFIEAFHRRPAGLPLGIGAQLALGFVFLLAFLLLISDPVRQLVLKPGRAINDIRIFLYFLMFISGLMFLVITFFPQ